MCLTHNKISFEMGPRGNFDRKSWTKISKIWFSASHPALPRETGNPLHANMMPNPKAPCCHARAAFPWELTACPNGPAKDQPNLPTVELAVEWWCLHFPNHLDQIKHFMRTFFASINAKKLPRFAYTINVHVLLMYAACMNPPCCPDPSSQTSPKGKHVPQNCPSF